MPIFVIFISAEVLFDGAFSHFFTVFFEHFFRRTNLRGFHYFAYRGSYNFHHIITVLHCDKYRNFTYFPGVEILWKDTVST